MDRPEKFDALESELDFLIQKAHRSGLNYWKIMRIMLHKAEILCTMADAEWYQKGG